MWVVVQMEGRMVRIQDEEDDCGARKQTRPQEINNLSGRIDLRPCGPLMTGQSGLEQSFCPCTSSPRRPDGAGPENRGARNSC